MTQINKTKPVLVTGATGYVAGWLVKRLLEDGLTVHAAVRDPHNQRKIAHLTALEQNLPGTLKFFKSDLLHPGSYDEAMNDCELVYHTASPFTRNIKDPQTELIDPAVKGTRNVLESVNRTPSVKRVVITSSCAAIYTDAIDCQKAPNGALTEEVWNTTASLSYQPYSFSKVEAEKTGWEMAKAQDRWDLVTINPSLIIGPALNEGNVTSETFAILKQMGDGTMKMGAPMLGIGAVDVRDVAEAHYRAGFTANASGRYITSAYNTNLLDLALLLRPKYAANYPLPKRKLPKSLLMVVGPIIDKELNRRFIRNNINIPWKADNSKIRHELKMEFRPLQTTMEEAFQSVIDSGLLSAKR
ncbi:MAG: NAD-dependent epimerase/dehydratase family protein [Flavobacteriales bacterium]|nr:NAD-dependent epimerase/dehydratase family protein [Bacteroidota bacterium]MCB9241900.1 NAD-dependent epimerase/dehydratase family protein [Flavobacteriales bacterium]